MSHSRAADFQDVAAKIAEDVAFLERYTKAISDYARSLPVERRVERLCDVVASAEEVAKRGLQEKTADLPNITLTMDIPEDIMLEIARELIVVALSHIITNAFEAILAKEPPVQGEVTLTARLVDDEVRITVADNGTGLSVEQVQALMAFVPGPKDNAKKESTGFGLPTASRYIRAHGGSLAIDGQEEVGAVVIISLPAKQNVRDEP
jgi:signal transduction histidine kinase